MERLTRKSRYEAGYETDKGIKIWQCLDRLGQYEDTNLTPEQMAEIDKDYRMMCEQMAEYKKLEEQGLLLRLPCKVGDTVYVVCECEMIPKQLDGTLYGDNGEPGTATGYYCPYEDNCPHDCEECDELFDCEKHKHKSAVFKDTVQSIRIDEYGVHIIADNCPVSSALGESIFLAESEAQEALERMGQND